MDNAVFAQLAEKVSNLQNNDLAKSRKEVAHLLKTIGNEHRLMILCLLMEAGNELSVTDLNHFIPVSPSALSQHLAILRRSNVVTTRRASQTIYYRIHDEKVNLVLDSLRDIYCKPHTTR